MKKIILSLLLLCAAVGIQAQTDRDACWLNATTGAWEWGFFKDFAVHDARQWQYASVKEGRKKTAVTLRSGKETLQLEIRYQNDSVCTIAVNDGKAQTYRLWNSAKSILSYLPTDTAASRPCQFHEDSVMLRGYLPEFPNQNLEYIYYERFQDTQKIANVPTDSIGRFELSLPVLGRTKVLFRIQSHMFSLLLSPQSECFLWIKGNSFLMMGEDGRINHELSDIQESFFVQPKTLRYPNVVSDSVCLSEIRKGLAEKEHALDALLKKHPNLSEDFRTLAKEDLYYSSLGRLITQSYDSHAQGNDHLLPGILDMIDSLMKEMPPVPTTVNSRYSNFISNYINYHNYQAHKHGNIAYDLRRLKQAMQEHRDLQVPDSLMQLIDHTLAMEARIKSREGKDTALVRTYHQNHEDIVKGLEASVQKNSFMDLSRT